MTAKSKCTCDVWPKIQDEFTWYSHSDGTKVMPCMPSGGVDYRVNYCPSCGGYVRDIERKGEL